MRIIITGTICLVALIPGAAQERADLPLSPVPQRTELAAPYYRRRLRPLPRQTGSKALPPPDLVSHLRRIEARRRATDQTNPLDFAQLSGSQRGGKAASAVGEGEVQTTPWIASTIHRLFCGIQAGISQGTESYPAFRQGAAGYGRYYWHTFADQTDENLWVEGILPSVLHQDSRYYTLGMAASSSEVSMRFREHSSRAQILEKKP